MPLIPIEKVVRLTETEVSTKWHLQVVYFLATTTYGYSSPGRDSYHEDQEENYKGKETCKASSAVRSKAARARIWGSTSAKQSGRSCVREKAKTPTCWTPQGTAQPPKSKPGPPAETTTLGKERAHFMKAFALIGNRRMAKPFVFCKSKLAKELLTNEGRSPPH